MIELPKSITASSLRPDKMVRACEKAKLLARVLTGIKVKDANPFIDAVRNKKGIEIGGPSGAFQDGGVLPLYRFVGSLDNCVFSSRTVWEGSRAQGATFHYYHKNSPGSNFICEATELLGIQDAAYDFVFSSHNLEHIANPVRALKEWRRITKSSGHLILLLPHGRWTFDHRREVTPVSHMVEDFERETDESDSTHFAEVIELHDLSRDKGAGAFEEFRRRCLSNVENRCLHHHVFDEVNSKGLLNAVGFKVQCIDFVRPHHIVILATV